MANEKEFRAGSCEESMRLYSVESHNHASYLVYLVKQQPEKERLKILDLSDQKAARLTPNSFIYNRRSYSQAGRRGFESPLPLHVFSGLPGIKPIAEPTFR